MNDREKKLAMGVALVVVLWCANLGWDKYQTAMKKNWSKQERIARKLNETSLATKRGKRAQEILKQWQRESLPTDSDIAKSSYQDWLQQQLLESGLEIKRLNPSQRPSVNSSQQFNFIVTAEGKLAKLTDFLYRFYRAKHLHRISSATLTPSTDRKQLTINLTIEALSLSDADRSDKLAEGTRDDISQSLNEFRKSIVGRNLFAVYTAPKQTPTKTIAQEKTTSEDNEAEKAKFSGIHYGQSGWQMLIRMKDSGKVYSFREGDQIKIGQFEGTVEQLDGESRRAIVSADSGQMLIQFGQTLAEAEPLNEKAG